MNKMRVLLAMLIIVTMALTGACGLKDDLYLPDESIETAPTENESTDDGKDPARSSTQTP